VKYLKITLPQAIELFNAIAEAKGVKLASTLEASKELEIHIKKAEELIPKIEELLTRSDELKSLYDLAVLTDQKLDLITTVSQWRRESCANRVGDFCEVEPLTERQIDFLEELVKIGKAEKVGESRTAEVLKKYGRRSNEGN